MSTAYAGLIAPAADRQPQPVPDLPRPDGRAYATPFARHTARQHDIDSGSRQTGVAEIDLDVTNAVGVEQITARVVHCVTRTLPLSGPVHDRAVRVSRHGVGRPGWQAVFPAATDLTVDALARQFGEAPAGHHTTARIHVLYGLTCRTAAVPLASGEAAVLVIGEPRRAVTVTGVPGGEALSIRTIVTVSITWDTGVLATTGIDATLAAMRDTFAALRLSPGPGADAYGAGTDWYRAQGRGDDGNDGCPQRTRRNGGGR